MYASLWAHIERKHRTDKSFSSLGRTLWLLKAHWCHGIVWERWNGWGKPKKNGVIRVGLVCDPKPTRRKLTFCTSAELMAKWRQSEHNVNGFSLPLMAKLQWNSTYSPLMVSLVRYKKKKTRERNPPRLTAAEIRYAEKLSRCNYLRNDVICRNATF